MKETQIVIILFVILGGIALYFFSESTIFNNEEESISDELKSDVEIKESNKIEEQPVIKEENERDKFIDQGRKFADLFLSYKSSQSSMQKLG